MYLIYIYIYIPNTQYFISLLNVIVKMHRNAATIIHHGNSKVNIATQQMHSVYHLLAFMMLNMSSIETIFSLGFCPSTFDLSTLSIAIQSEKKVGNTPAGIINYYQLVIAAANLPHTYMYMHVIVVRRRGLQLGWQELLESVVAV